MEERRAWASLEREKILMPSHRPIQKKKKEKKIQLV
jgi:hypothetical protein